MTREVMVRTAADRDVDEIADYLAANSPRAVKIFYDSLTETFAELAAQAEIGQRFDFADGS